MICRNCGTVFNDGIFCPECGARNVLSEEEELREKMRENTERKARENAERAVEVKGKKQAQEVRKAAKQQEQARMTEENENVRQDQIKLAARTYRGIVYASEEEARKAAEENNAIDILKKRLESTKSQERRLEMVSEFQSDFQTPEAKKRLELLQIKVNQKKPKSITINNIYGITVLATLVIGVVLTCIGEDISNVALFFDVWAGIGVWVWSIWKIILLIKSRTKNYYLYIKDI